MRRSPRRPSSAGGALDTLAQTGTAFAAEKAVILCGQGADISANNYGQKKGKRKMIGLAMSLSLIDIAKKKTRDVTELQSYWNTYYCLSSVYISEGRLHGKYCKNRFCPICSSIRKAELINKYYPTLAGWEAPYFVTLTVKACKARELKAKLKKIDAVMKRLQARNKKRSQRSKCCRWMGIRSIECNFNPASATYNPHVHLIVAGKDMANELMAEWLKEWGVWEASGSGQHKRAVEDLQHDLIEAIKYGTKIFTEPDVQKKARGGKDNKIYAAAFYNIIQAFKGLRLFERFGFDLPKERKTCHAPRVSTDYVQMIYVPEFHEWLEPESGLPLTGYAPGQELINLLRCEIDMERE